MQQNCAEVTGVIVVSDLDAAQASELVARIRAQAITATVGWGEPVLWPGGRLAVRLRRGPMLGAWPGLSCKPTTTLMGTGSRYLRCRNALICIEDLIAVGSS
jgi:hypothetical protein